MKKIAGALIAVFVLTICACNKNQITLVTQEVSIGRDYELRKIFFLNDSVGYVCGGLRYDIGVLLKTTNGGSTWSAPDSLIPKIPYALFFFDESEGMMAGYNSWVAYTRDSGKTYLTGTGDYQPINDIQFIDHSYGVKVGGDAYDNGFIAGTSDGGNTWSQINYKDNFRAVKYADSNTVFASGYGTIYKSMDKGLTFKPLDVRGDFFVAMDFPSPGVGYFVGYEGMVLKTSDAGNSFKKVKTENTPFSKSEHFEGVDFWDNETGYIVGDAGIMFKTTNGGGKWEKVKPFTSSNLRCIHLFSDRSGIISADNGKIYLFKD